MKTASKSIVGLLMFVSLVTAASARVPDATAKMRGQYGSSVASRSYPRNETYRAPAAIAQAPASTRTSRSFSYDPAPNARRAPAVTAAPQVTPTRRFSYEPSRSNGVYRAPATGINRSWAPSIHGADAKMKGNY